jgi:hypothetical protein
VPRDEAVLSAEDFAALVQAFTATGFRGANSWYLNDEANLAYAAAAPDGGRLLMPVLFVHARWDPTCSTVGTALAEPMRAACADLTEMVVDSGHYVSLENPRVSRHRSIAGSRRSTDRETARPRDRETARPRDRETARPRDRETARPRDRETARPRDRETVSGIGPASDTAPEPRV